MKTTQIKYEKPDNLVSSFEGSVKKHPRNPFIGEKDKDGHYQWITYRDLSKRVDHLRSALAQLGVESQHRVGVIANNRKEWVQIALATYGLGASFVPMYESELEKLWKYIVENSEIKVLFVSNLEIYEAVAPFLVTISTLDQIFIIEDDGDDSLIELEKKGQDKPLAPIHPKAEDIANVVYTSGTTGDPKGVLLSHGNITSNSRAGWRVYPFLNQKSMSISILPWAHSYGATAELFCFMQFGGRIGIMGSVKTLAQDIETLKPHIIMGVPRVFSKIYEGLNRKIKQKNFMIKHLFNMGINSWEKKHKNKLKSKSNLISATKHKIVSKVIYSKIRKKLGGNVQACLTASASINPEVIKFFMALGLPLYEAYGLTECSPAITMNYPGNFRIGSVGKALEYVEIKIDKSVIEDESKDGEILARGPNVMQGYLKKPEQTKEVITDDGWVRTGDRGFLDEDGFLFITGRIMEQYKLMNGKYVFPAALEKDICHNHYISHAFVYGSGMEYNVALIVPDFESLTPFAEKKNISTDPEDIIKQIGIKSLFLHEIKKDLEGEYGHYEIPRKVLLSAEPFSIENGILTQTMKPKRRVILDRYEEQLKELYKTGTK
jgi:long-chain acyl-CoA synthetase